MRKYMDLHFKEITKYIMVPSECVIYGSGSKLERFNPSNTVMN